GAIAGPAVSLASLGRRSTACPQTQVVEACPARKAREPGSLTATVAPAARRLAPFTPDRSWLADGGRSASGPDPFCSARSPTIISGGTRPAKTVSSGGRYAASAVDPPSPPAGELLPIPFRS